MKLLLEAVTMAHATAPREAVLTQFCHLFAQALDADEIYVYLYDSARRLVQQASFAGESRTDNVLHAHWNAIGTAMAQQRATFEQGFVCIPLVAGAQTIGIVLIHVEPPIAERFPLLTSIAQLLAGALDRCEMNSRAAQQQQAATKLQSVYNALFAAQQLDDLFELIAEATQRLSGAARSMIFLRDGTVWLRPVQRRDVRRQHSAVPIRGSRIGEVVLAAQPRICMIPTIEWNIPTGSGVPETLELLAVPLCLNEAVIGVLTGIGKPGGFSNEDLQLVRVFAEHAALAINRAQRGTQPRGHPSVSSQLTKREREVLALIAQGQTNQEIAHRLTITERTVSTHLSNILGKLGLTSRTQAALYALDHRE